MTCADLLRSDKLSELKLAGGKDGLNNVIRWIHFGDRLADKSLFEDFYKWLSGGELLLFTNGFISDRQYMRSIMEQGVKYHIAGIIVNQEFMEDCFADFADELDLPLFVMPRTLRAVDMTQIVCTELINEQMENSATERILNSILFTGYESEHRLISQAKDYGIDLHKSCGVCIVSMENFSQYLESNKITDSEFINKIKTSFLKFVKTAFESCGGRKILAMILMDSIVVLYETDLMSGDKYERMYSEIKRNTQYSFPGLSFVIGVGNGYNTVGRLKKSYEEAEKAIEFRYMQQEDRHILFYDDLGLYSLLLRIDDEYTMERYCRRYIGDLMDYDRLNSTNLCETLEIYLNSNLNANETADKLFIHRNTLRYRLDKIKSIVGGDLNNISQIVNLATAFQIKRYLDSGRA